MTEMAMLSHGERSEGGMRVQETQRGRDEKEKRATKRRTGRRAKKERSHDSSADTKQTKDRK